MILAIRSLLVGLSVTLREFFKAPITVQYPEARPFTGARWRGVHGLFFTKNVTEELCISCHLCARVCPAVCIEMEGHVQPDGTKYLHKFDVDLGRCIYCGYCEEVCPVDCIRLTTSTDYTVRDRANFVLHKEDMLSIAKNAMSRGEHGALGVRGNDGLSVIHETPHNRRARFDANPHHGATPGGGGH